MAKTSERSATKAGRFTECPLFAATWDVWSDGMKPTALGTAPATGHVSLWTGVLSTALPPNHWAPVSPAKVAAGEPELMGKESNVRFGWRSQRVDATLYL